MKQELDQDWEFNRLDDTSRDIDPYRELIVKNAGKTDTILPRIGQWSILINVVNYIQYDRYPKNFYNLNIRAVNKEKHKVKYNIEEERQMFRIGFWRHAREFKEEYLDIYDRIQSETLSTTRFDENSDLSTTYLERVDMTRSM